MPEARLCTYVMCLELEALPHVRVRACLACPLSSDVPLSDKFKLKTVQPEQP